MVRKPVKPFAQVVADAGRYPEDAFHFVREALNFAVEKIHGPSTPQQIALYELLDQKSIDLHELVEAYECGSLSPQFARAIEAAGGIDTLNRHVSGVELSWAVREYALDRWGRLARIVLHRWNVRETLDFGRIVFAMVENGYMQKQPHDSIDDFRNVFDFREAFDDAYHIPCDAEE
jgi:uncharacterized repeat protein (TIGR04138 family)